MTAPRPGYEAYLDRVARHLGSVQVGGYAKYRGRLIKRLSFEEFSERWTSFQQLHAALERSMARGDTVNDAVQQLLDEHTAELLLDPVDDQLRK